MANTPSAVLSDIKAGKYAPVYFLQGDESFYIDQIADYIEENAIEEAQKGFNQVIVYGKDIDVAGILNHAKRFPMMSDRQVVIVKEAHEIADLGKEDRQKMMLTYLQNPVPSTILVFCYKYKTLDKRKALGKNIEKLAVCVTSKKMYDNQLPDWVESYIKTKGCTIEVKAKQMLVDFLGNDLKKLSNEIDKILINFTGSITISPEHVQKYVGISKEYNVFELQNAIINKNVVKANKIVNYFEANPRKNPIIPVIAVLFGFFSKLLIGHHQKDKSDANLSSAMGVNKFFLKDYKNALRHYNLLKTIHSLGYLKEADLRSKGVGSGTMTEGDNLRELVFKILH